MSLSGSRSDSKENRAEPFTTSTTPIKPLDEIEGVVEPPVDGKQFFRE
jgi:hypothetical protein